MRLAFDGCGEFDVLARDATGRVRAQGDGELAGAGEVHIRVVLLSGHPWLLGRPARSAVAGMWLGSSREFEQRGVAGW